MSRKGWLLFIAMSMIWGIPYLFIKIAVRELDPAVVVLARVGIAAARAASYSSSTRRIATTARAMAHHRRDRLCADRRAIFADQLRRAAHRIVTHQPAHRRRSAARCALRAALCPRRARHWPTPDRAAGWHDRRHHHIRSRLGGDSQRLLGAFLVLLAAAGYAASALLIKQPSIATLPSLGVVTLECVTATIVVLPVAVTRLPGKLPSLEVIASLLVLSLICTALAYLIFFALVAEVGASRGTVITYVNPAVSVLLGVSLLGETLNAAILVGFLLIIAGSWLSTGGVLPPRLRQLLRTPRQQQTIPDTVASRQETSHQQLQ